MSLVGSLQRNGGNFMSVLVVKHNTGDVSLKKIKENDVITPTPHQGVFTLYFAPITIIQT